MMLLHFVRGSQSLPWHRTICQANRAQVGKSGTLVLAYGVRGVCAHREAAVPVGTDFEMPVTGPHSGISTALTPQSLELKSAARGHYFIRKVFDVIEQLILQQGPIARFKNK